MQDIRFPKILKVEVFFSPKADIDTNAWVGAIFRNGFLYATSLVQTGQGNSLFDAICQCPLDSRHPLHKHYTGGFPKPFVIDCRTISKGQTGKRFRIKAGRIYSFSLNIFGEHCVYKDSYIDAVRIFVERGIGTPKVPMTLLDVKSAVYDFTTLSDFRCFMNSEEGESGATLSSNPEESEVCFTFLTPVSLVQPAVSRYSEKAFQDKMNGFPSFYQIVRSLFYRLVSLEILYGKEKPDCGMDEIDEYVNSNLGASVRAVLTDARISKYLVISTRKKDAGFVYKMSGYIGSLSFSNVSSEYLPLLEWGEFAGVGNDISYGLGLYKADFNVKF